MEIFRTDQAFIPAMGAAYFYMSVSIKSASVQ